MAKQVDALTRQLATHTSAGGGLDALQQEKNQELLQRVQNLEAVQLQNEKLQAEIGMQAETQKQAELDVQQKDQVLAAAAAEAGRLRAEMLGQQDGNDKVRAELEGTLAESRAENGKLRTDLEVRPQGKADFLVLSSAFLI